MAEKTLNPRIHAFISMYRDLIGPKPTPEQTLLLHYFELAGNELPLYGGRHWFYKAWRQVDILPEQRGPGSRDMVVWHLITLDEVVDTVVEALLPEFEVPPEVDDFVGMRAL